MPAIPYVGSLYDYAHGPGAGISQLMLEQGRARAANSERQGQIWGGTIANLGGLAGQEIERKQEFKRSQALSQAMEAYISDPNAKPEQAYLAVSKIMEPSKALTVANGMVAFKKAAAADTPPEIALAELPNIWDTYKILPEAMRPGTLAKIKQALGSKIDMSQVPDQLTPEAEKAIDTYIDKLRPKEKDIYEEERLKAAGKAAGTPSEPPKEYKVTVPGPNGPIERLATEDELRAGVQGYRAPTQPSMPSFQSKEVLGDDGKPVMANFNARTGKYTYPATGQEIRGPKPVPSATESRDEAKFKTAAPVLASVSELSERINTLQGVVAKASGEAEKAKAKINLNDDVAEYQALVEGFTPLVARALGHTGVLTQQDVDSVKMLFPKPGESKSLRDRKVKRVMSIIGQLDGSAVASPPPPPPGFELMEDQ